MPRHTRSLALWLPLVFLPLLLCCAFILFIGSVAMWNVSLPMPRNSTRLNTSGDTGNSTSYPTFALVIFGNSPAGLLMPCAASVVNDLVSSVPSGTKQSYGKCGNAQ